MRNTTILKSAIITINSDQKIYRLSIIRHIVQAVLNLHGEHIPENYHINQIQVKREQFFHIQSLTCILTYQTQWKFQIVIHNTTQ